MLIFIVGVICLILGFVLGFGLMLFYAERRRKWDNEVRLKNAKLIRDDQLETVYNTLNQNGKLVFKKEIEKFLSTLK